MATDFQASDPAFGRHPTDVTELVSWARAQLGTTAPWTVVSSRAKLGKVLFEFEENGRILVGKVATSDRALHTYERQKLLWDAGMRPPAKRVVTEPVAWLAERKLLIQTRAEGTQVFELVRANDHGALRAAVAAAEWLHVLQRLNVKLPPAPSRSESIERCCAELVDALPEHAEAIQTVTAEITPELEAHSDRLVPSHGDFHPMNLFLTTDDRLTAIDFDTLALRPASFDVSYFVAQTAIMGWHLLGGFEQTACLRSEFLQNAPASCVGAEVRWAFLRALHFDICILKLREVRHVEPFVEAAVQGLP